MDSLRAMITIFSIIGSGLIAYAFYHILITGDIVKILISGALGIATIVLLISQLKKNLKG